MKTLYLIRHGQAQPAAGLDSERALTEQGQQEVIAMSASLPASCDLFFASPYVRAQQTAQLIAQRLNAELMTVPLITPEGLPSQVDQWLQSQTWTVAVMVSHQPLVGMLAEYYSDTSCRHFPTAGVVRLEAEMMAQGCATLTWL